MSSFPNEQGGLIDDCIITRRADHLFLVVNGACRAKDVAMLKSKIADFRAKGGDVTMEEWDAGRQLIALQGPKAAIALQRVLPSSVDLSKVPFLSVLNAPIAGAMCQISRCGYTGLH